MGIRDVLLDRMVNYLDNLVDYSKIKINGEYVRYPIFKTVREVNLLRKYIYVDTEIGVVTEGQLLSSDNQVLVNKIFNVTKEQDGLMLAFEFEIKVK